MGSNPLVRHAQPVPPERELEFVRKVRDVPSLFRFLAILAIIGGAIFAAIFALATFVEPTQREMSVAIPNAKLQPGGK